MFAVWHSEEKKVYYHLLAEHAEVIMMEASDSVKVRMPKTASDARTIAVDQILDVLAARTGKHEWWDAVDYNIATATTKIYPELAR